MKCSYCGSENVLNLKTKVKTTEGDKILYACRDCNHVGKAKIDKADIYS